MIGGTVSHVRELSTGIQADVSIGSSGTHGYATIRICSQSPDVMRALDALKAALRAEADATIKAAQRDEIKRGRTALGYLPTPVADSSDDSSNDTQRSATA